MSVSSYALEPFDGPRESVTDDLVGLVAGVVEWRRANQAAYGALVMTEAQRDEMARAIAANILAEFKLERLP